MRKEHLIPQKKREVSELLEGVPENLWKAVLLEYQGCNILHVDLAQYASLLVKHQMGKLKQVQEAQFFLMRRRFGIIKKTKEIRLRFAGCELPDNFIKEFARLLFRKENRLIDPAVEEPRLNLLEVQAQAALQRREERQRQAVEAYSQQQLFAQGGRSEVNSGSLQRFSKELYSSGTSYPRIPIVKNPNEDE